MANNPGVAEIQAKRRKLLDGLDANEGFEQGLHDSATDQYAGRCHFIYELLQNAGDADATEVEFTLAKDSLEFRHNGSRLFRIEDVNSITNYHQSTKKGEDYEAVGKFGMGFKSVFFYTTTPEIHSGDYHFQIKRMFYPETDGVRTDENLGGWTKFLFPFQHKNRSSKDIFQEVRQGLGEIRGETLLFLRKIRKIECMFEDGTWLSISREEHEHIVRILRSESNGRSACQYFLKFTKTIREEDGGRGLDIAMAYGLVSEASVLPTSDVRSLSPNRFTIRPLRGRVFVYFPAEKETSNLQFHINAPFATPMSRESLTECSDNDWLLGEISRLVVESLSYLRDNGLLKVETLSVFPIDKDQLPQKYRLFERDIVTAFNSRDLTPTKSGAFKCANALIRSENRLSDLFSDEDMARIYRKYAAPIWVKAPSMVHSREDEFLNSLDLQTFGNDDLLSLVCGGSNASVHFSRFISDLDDKRCLEVYKKLSGIDMDAHCYSSMGDIFRATDGKMYAASSLYFAPRQNVDVGATADKFLKPIFSESDPRVFTFFKKAGVREYSAENVLEKCFRFCPKPTVANEDQKKAHVLCVSLLIEAYRKNPTCLSRFKDMMWFCEDAAGNLRLDFARNIVIDDPYESNAMQSILRAWPDRYRLSKVYKDGYSEGDYAVLRKIFSECPFVRGIKERYTEEYGYVSLWGHPRYVELKLPDRARQRDPWYRDCKIDRLDDLIRHLDDDISNRLWNLIVGLKDRGLARNPFKAICHHSASCVKEADSILICDLQSKAWVKAIDGKWHRPEEVGFATLDSMYGHRTICDGLRAVRFGVKAAQIEQANIEKRKEVDNFVKSVGARNEDEVREAVDMMRRARQCGIDVKGQILQRETSASMPESPSGNVERRQQRAGEDFKVAENQTREMRERSVRVSNSREQEARVRLERDYTDDKKQMRCQLCRMPMPFNKRDGQPYFECVQIFRDMAKETPDQYLALCPNCRAAYDEWVRKLETNRDRLKEEILSKVVSNGQGSVTVMLPNYGTPACKVPPTNGMSLYFVASHFIDLRAVLRTEEI